MNDVPPVTCPEPVQRAVMVQHWTDLVFLHWPMDVAAVQRRLESTVLPGLGDALTTSLMLAPLDFRDRLASEKGAAFAMEPKLFQSAWFRPHNRSEEVEGLYVVGAGTHPGAALPGVVSSANLLDKIVPPPSRPR